MAAVRHSAAGDEGLMIVRARAVSGGGKSWTSPRLTASPPTGSARVCFSGVTRADIAVWSLSAVIMVALIVGLFQGCAAEVYAVTGHETPNLTRSGKRSLPPVRREIVDLQWVEMRCNDHVARGEGGSR
jgi:hypothetical protein